MLHLRMLHSPTPQLPILYKLQTSVSLILKHLPSSSPIMSVVPWKKLLGESLNDGQVCHTVYLSVISSMNHSFIDPIEYAHDHADLGAALNGFSLNETGALSGAIEKTGQTVDATYISTTKLVRTLIFSSPT
jgi:hypothetical protein